MPILPITISVFRKLCFYLFGSACYSLCMFFNITNNYVSIKRKL